jgi:hypothetical protein
MCNLAANLVTLARSVLIIFTKPSKSDMGFKPKIQIPEWRLLFHEDSSAL